MMHPYQPPYQYDTQKPLLLNDTVINKLGKPLLG